MKSCGFLLFFVVATLSSTTLATDYCRPELCDGISEQHIGCNANHEFSPHCPDNAEMVDITEELQDLIVSEINEYRNFIAGGGHEKHSPACRMATIQWDNELAELAALNVKQCSMEHDQCHNTDDFLYSGQNLAWSGFDGELETEAELKSALKAWYDEVEDSEMSFIKKLPMDTDGRVVGHFTVLVADKNIRVGCAASIYSNEESFNEFLFACNFATTNMIDHPIYKDCSEAASSCTSGTNPNYPNLCSTSEEYEVNEWS